MKDKVLKRGALNRVRNIHRLSKKYNRKVNFPHDRRLFELMRRHAHEISQLYAEGNPHYLIETGDLLVLCCEILLEGKASIDATLLGCFERYDNKLTALLKEAARPKKR